MHSVSCTDTGTSHGRVTHPAAPKAILIASQAWNIASRIDSPCSAVAGSSMVAWKGNSANAGKEGAGVGAQ